MKKSTFKIDGSIQAIVDDQLQDSGSFSPLDFLLTSGRLSYNAYEAWRFRDKEYLEELLSGNIDKVISQLQQACDYADHLGLSRVQARIMSWSRADTTETRNLRFSKNSDLEALLSIQFEAKNEHPQQDLFINNPVTALINDLIASILTRNLSDAEGYLDELYIKAPDHGDLPGFDLLVHGLGAMQRPAAGKMSELQSSLQPELQTELQSELHSELQIVEEQLIGIAQELLGNKWRDYINGVWHWLANATMDWPYNPKHPKLHASYLLAQAGDWSRVRQLIEAEGNYTRVAEMGFRLAQALHFLDERATQIEVWCRLCWAFPDDSEDYLSSGELGSSSVKQLWLDYLDMEATLDLSEPLDCGLFPAWILIQEPGLVHRLPQDMLQGEMEHQVTFRLAHNLIMARMNDEPEIEHRKALGNREPVLLKHYLHGIKTR